MDSGIWKMQQEARVRVATQRAREHRVVEEENRRTAASLRAARPPEHKPAPPVPEPPPRPVPVPKPAPAMDGEQIMLLLLALLLSQAGASKMLVIALLYLAM